MCNPEMEMPEGQSVAGVYRRGELLVLGVDTCGPSGTVALARIEEDKAAILGQKDLAGRIYSATLVSAVGDLLVEMGLKLADLGAIVVVNGPGSFTGVRVGLSAVKGLAEPGQIPVLAVSRLAVMAWKAGVDSAALDAHRHEVFLRVARAGRGVRELLAGAEELAELEPARLGLKISQVPKIEGPGTPGVIAVCDEGAAELVGQVWDRAELVRVDAPTAADAVGLCVPRILAHEFDDLVLLDGHYLRRSDAEIFGEAPKIAAQEGYGIRVRKMTPVDLDAVLEMARKTDQAPKWVRQAYIDALDPLKQPRRVALVAEKGPGGLVGFAVASLMPATGLPTAGLTATAGRSSESELESIVTDLPHQRRGVARELFAALKAELRCSSVSEVILEVREGNRAARGFYRFLGFREEGRRRGYYDEPVEDAILMRLRLI
jgi:tRNA threonylcarbamoyladenosine biosynthesis protein TsaB